MLKLNKRKIRWIVRQIDKKELSTYMIAKIQKITPRHARRVYAKYKGVKDPILLPCGSKPRPITKEERRAILNLRKEHPLGAVNLETILDERGIHIGHNRIHHILKEEHLAKDEPKKKNRRKWIRYQRRHSNSLWHVDWFEEDGEQLIVIEDDASRLLTGFGVFFNATTDNSAFVLENAIDRFGNPKQLMTDHGIQFTSLPREGCADPGPNEFQRCLTSHGIKHIKARVKHPQSNGKAERIVQTLKKHKKDFGSWKKAIDYYNFKRPHMSLNNGHTRTPYQAFLDKMR